MYPDCWTVLNVSCWLPEWFLKTSKCLPGHQNTDCQIADPGVAPEPWAQTFLREAEGGAPGNCTSITQTTCAYMFNNLENSIKGAINGDLERARFRYVRYNIYGKSFLEERTQCHK